ncbi:MAG: hypothetical protein M9921_05870 [Fimbriimonadaceae bacterium]|nr:hypothetical protein [Fimbriimonadaceae bacterium]
MAGWRAHWISPAYDPRLDVGVFGFRRRLQVTEVPSTLIARVSADQRYKLFVNGELVVWGPQRGDPQHWFYETVDLAPHLRAGENWIAALVWNFGWMAPMAQHSVRTAFVLEAEGASTPDAWEVLKLGNWDFAMMHDGVGEFYIDVGPGEAVDFRGAPWGWRTGGDSPPAEWRPAHTVCAAEERGTPGGGTPWMLVPRTLPAMRYDVCETGPRVRRGFLGDEGGPEEGALSPPLALRPGQPVVLDWGELLCAFPRLTLEGPEGAGLTVAYAEAPWTPDGAKGNRNEVAGKAVQGMQDRFVLDGTRRTLETLWWRTFRYVRLEATQTLTVHAFDAVETGYPIAVDSSFEADDPWVQPIWEVAVRTAERCAGETYFDCPYYEQLQYAGDTRIQALIGYYLGHDRALQRNAVDTLGWSQMANGLTQSRYPSRQVQVIPPFSAWWVLMLYDQMLYDRVAYDVGRQRQAEWVLESLEAHSDAPDAPFWHFADWVPGWRWGEPPLRGRSPIHRLTREMAWRGLGAFMETAPMPLDLAIETEMAARGLEMPSFAAANPPSPSREGFDEEPSEHAEALWRVWQRMAGLEPDPWPAEALAKAGAARCTYYFSYYKHLAMRPIDYLAGLAPWKEMIEAGLTTFAENPEPTRSDCHAWSAHPILGFFQIVAGVESAAPGWKAARIEPHPGSLRRFDARIAHPDGLLRVAWESERLTIDSPVPYELVWRGRREKRPAGQETL